VTALGGHSAAVKRRGRIVSGLLASPRDARLSLRMAGWRLLLPILKRRLPLPRLAAIMWAGGGSEREPEREARIAELAIIVFRSQHSE
jgi:hypothetical protein